MKTKITLEEDTIRLFQRYGIILNTEDGKTYYFFPYWLECHTDDDEFTFILHKLGDDLPAELMDEINKNRL